MPHAPAPLRLEQSRRASFAALRAALWFFAALSPGCAHPPRQSPAVGPAQPPPEAAPQTAAAEAGGPQAGERPPTALALGVFELQLPGCGTNPRPAEQAFCTSATRAVRQAYEDDNDDPSVLLALANDLEVNPALGQLQPLWRNPLGHALSRSEGLLRLGPTLRLLRRAVADAYLDQVSQIYRGVNTEACRAAFALLPADEPHWLEMVVTIEPLGTYPLSRLRRFCLDSRTLG